MGANVAANCGHSSPAESLHFLFTFPPPIGRGATNGYSRVPTQKAAHWQEAKPDGGRAAVDDKLQGARRARDPSCLSILRNIVTRSSRCSTLAPTWAVAKGGKEVQLGTVSGLGLISHHQTQQLGPWQRDSQLTNGASRHERRHGA